MYFAHLLPVTLLSLCAAGSPIARRELRAVNQVYNGSIYNTTQGYLNSTCNDTDVYTMYNGDGSSTNGWPSTNQWLSFTDLWNANLALIRNSCSYIGATGPNNSPEETTTVGTMILAVANDTNVDPRFILAMVMQESKGCVRVQTTFGSHSNPGLMQSHDGINSCAGIDPCSASTIYGMIQDGVGGTATGDGVAGIMNELQAGDATNELFFGNDTTQAQVYYRAARMYNSGSIDPSGNLGLGGSTHCYASDIANRLTGWVFALSTCMLDVVKPDDGVTTISSTSNCITAQPGNTCDEVANDLSVSTAEFLAANPSIDAQCSNMLAGTTYCA